MKVVLFLSIIFFGFSVAVSQDILLKEYTAMILAKDSLEKQVIKPLNDSILKLNSAHKAEISKLQDQLKALENDTAVLNKKIKFLESGITDLNKDKVKVERDNLQKKSDSLFSRVTELEKTISERDELIKKEKKLCVENSMQEKEKGKQEILKQLILIYNKPFDELIKSFTKKSVERDLLLVKDNIEVQQKLQNLKKYFDAEQVLSEKYNEQKVKTAQTQITSLDSTAFVNKLTDKLDDYLLCNNGLKTTIDSVLVIDKRIIANDDYSQEKKLQKILAELAWYFRNYHFNFTDYPYLSDIVLDIIKQKQKDANADISLFKAKL